MKSTIVAASGHFRRVWWPPPTRLHHHHAGDTIMADGAILIPSSSSPPAPRPPSPSPPPPITTTTTTTTATATDSSSPGLPSPSTFFTNPLVGAATSFTRTKHCTAPQDGGTPNEVRAGKRPKVNKAATLPIEEQPRQQTVARLRSPGISLAVYGVDDGDGTVTKPAEVPVKKPRKALEKKSRKPLAKSASFVLNSDDLASTQFAGLDAAHIQGSRPADIQTLRHEDAPEKPKRAARKSKQAEGEPGTKKKAKNETAKQSAYFAQPSVPGNDSAMNAGMTAEAVSIEATATPIPARRRRLSWTPPKNTTAAAGNAKPESAASAVSDHDEPLPISLAAILGDLTYAKNDTTAPRRSASGEALLKRRRIELADESTVAPKARKPPAEPKEKVKKAKLPKKKPQTITEIATKAYRPEDDVAAAQATVSSFFTSRGDDSGPTAQVVQTEVTAVKTKQPRKPREKKTGDSAASNKPQKTTKPRSKAKLRCNDDDLFGELYEPEQARLQEGNQDFLFGTSSQLGTRDSPTFIRHMQLAMRESETMSTAQPVVSPSRKSYVGVPTAPHGTSLSLGQGTRELWCSAARDHENDTFAAEDRSPAQSDDVPPTSPKLQIPAQAGLTRHQSLAAPASLPSPSSERHRGPVNQDMPGQTEHGIVDLCYTSPVAAHDGGDSLFQPALQEERLEASAIAETAACASHPALDEDWMILRSGNSSPDVPLSKRQDLQAPESAPQLRRSVLSPRRDRSALQALDANVSPRLQTSPLKAFLPKSLPATSITPIQKKPRGLPKKAAIISAGPASPKRRRKRLSPSASAESQPLPQIDQHSTGKIFSASQPIASSDFVNIDEISDSDSPSTHSPLRRQTTSTPPIICPLELEVVASPSVKSRDRSKKPESKDTTAASLAWSKLKPDGAGWAAVLPVLFPQITAMVKSTPPSNDMAKPTWYEKILLYDPIVLEDLTAWLNDQGVRVETKKPKVKPKAPAGKKKKKEAAQHVERMEAHEGAADEDEDETVRELLKPWMVQKWCEDQSICCLWKEGLRGGVRTRY